MKNIAKGLFAAAALTLACALPAQAATVVECNNYAMSTYVMEPWEKNTRTFYNGGVRVAAVDTDGEPACCSTWLVVIFPDVQDELGGRTCRMVGSAGGLGFTGVDIKGIKTAYDAATGLTLTVPVRRMIDGDAIRPETVRLLLDLRTSTLSVVP
jgi:hypothetical protein